MADDIHQVELVFDDQTGELKDVNPLGNGKRVDEGETIDINYLTEKQRLKKLTSHCIIYGFGSPGCVTYRTSSGYITICW